MRIRRVRPDEYAEIGEITLAAYQQFTEGPDDPYLERLVDTETRDGQAEVYVAESGGRLLGSVTWCPPGSPWQELAGPGDGEFRMLAVAPTAQGRGVGEALTRHCVALAQAGGLARVVLSSLPEMAAAHRVYRRLGFDRTPEADWSPIPGVELIGFAADLPAVPGGMARFEQVVTDADTAAAVGSGTLPVLGTPRLIAWLEGASCAAVDHLVPEGGTTVGTRIDVRHLAASPVGDLVRLTAVVRSVDRRRYLFGVTARGADHRLLAHGEIGRVQVDARRFLDSLPAPSPGTIDDAR